MKYSFPALFTLEEKGLVAVQFQDFGEDVLVTCGDNELHALEMALDVLPFALIRYEDEGKPIPTPSSMFDLNVPEELKGKAFYTLIYADTEAYREELKNLDIEEGESNE